MLVVADRFVDDRSNHLRPVGDPSGYLEIEIRKTATRLREQSMRPHRQIDLLAGSGRTSFMNALSLLAAVIRPLSLQERQERFRAS